MSLSFLVPLSRCSITFSVFILLFLAGAGQSHAALNKSKSVYAGVQVAQKPLKNQPSSLARRSISNPAKQVNDYLASLTRRTAARSAVRHQAALITPEQQSVLANLRHDTPDGKVVAEFDADNGTVAFLKGNFENVAPYQSRSAGPGDLTLVSQRFLRNNKSLLKLNNPDAELKATATKVDEFGFAHIKHQQMYEGVPVYAKELMVHLNEKGMPYLVNGRYIPSIEGLDVNPTLTTEEAKDKVRAYFSPVILDFLTDELLIYPDGDQYHLAYRLETRKSTKEYWDYFVDAHSGDILHRITRIQEVSVSASGNGVDNNRVSFNAWDNGDGFFYLLDTLTMQSGEDFSQTSLADLYFSRGVISVIDGQNGELGPQFNPTVTRSSGRNGGWDPIAVSALHNAELTYQYFQDNFGRNSLNDDSYNLLSVVHYGEGEDNAFWDGRFIYYGDGEQVFSPLAGCLDVAAHEISHGLISFTANFIYQNQSGALNESFADVFGALIDDDNWLIGEDCTLIAPGHLRSMRTPANGLTPQPGKMSQYRNLPNTEGGDNGGVHVNSGIPNRAAFLTADQVGRVKAGEIYYRALTQYLTRSSRFIDARRALIQAATDLYGEASMEVAAVKEAWDTVEVREGDSIAPPGSIASADGEDRMYYLYPHPEIANTLYLFAQTMTESRAYQESLDRQLYDQPVFFARPAPFTSAGGSGVFFVDTNNNVLAVDPQGNVGQVFGNNDISSISISPDGRYFAYTTVFSDDNNIHILDLDEETQISYPIDLPDFQEGGADASNMVRYADSLDFDYSSKKLVFDMLVCSPGISNPCDVSNTQSGVNYWSIGVLDFSLAEPRFSFPFPNQEIGTQYGYPTFAANTNQVIALDITRPDNTVEGTIFNFETQQFIPIVTQSQLDSPSEAFTFPSFWGGDDFVTLQIPAQELPEVDDAVGSAAISIPVNQQTWQSDVSAYTVINPFAVIAPIMHRTGFRAITNNLEVSANNMDFGDVASGTAKTKQITIHNRGNDGVDITSMQIMNGNEVFRLAQGTNTHLPGGSQLIVAVSFNPTSDLGTAVGTLDVVSNGNPSTLSVSLKGNSVAASTGETENDNDETGSGGGGSFDFLFLLLMFTAFLGIRIKRMNGRGNY